MTTYYIDPSLGSNGSGTFTSPRNIVPTSLVYGDIVLFKENTTYIGGWTLPTPTGVGSDTNRIIIGTYAKDTGLQITAKPRAAKIYANANQSGILLNSISYVSIINLSIDGARDFPEAGIRTVNSSYTTVDSCVINMTRPLFGGSYGIRFSNNTGAGTSQSNWKVTNTDILKTGGNSGIYFVWGANSGEYVTDITITNNTVVGNGELFTGANFTGIALVPRASSIYLNRAGLCSKGVLIQGNIVSSTIGYAYSTAGVEAGGTQKNLFSKNKAFNVNPGGAADAHCMWFAACSNFTIENNLVKDSTALVGSTFGSCVGIFIDMNGFGADNDGCQDMIVRKNRVYNTGRGATANLEVGGAGILVFMSQRIQVYSNYVQGCSNGIVCIGWYGTGNKCDTIDIFNNTVVNSRGANYYICKAANLVSVKNNISVLGNTGYYIENTGATPITNYTEKNNLVYSPVTYKWLGGDEPTATPPTFTPRTPDVSNVEFDPKITLMGVPKRDSSVGSSGILVGSFVDAFSISFQNPPSIGAYEYMRPRTFRS